MKNKLFKTNSMTFVIGVSVLLLLGSYVMPMRTSLGQGVDERTATGWQAVMNPQTHAEYYRMNFSDNSFLQFSISGLPKNLFDKRTADGNLGTAADLPVVIQAAYQQDKTRLERTLGTFGNAPSLFHPFAEVPIAYSSAFLEALTQKSINPKTYGGPNVPPGSIKVKQLPSGVLHIDTKANNNTIAQCLPGESPPSLQGLST